MIAALLAGGLGTRLAAVLPDRPKSLAPIGDRIFLDLLLRFLATQGIGKVVLCLGFRAEQVIAHLARQESPLPVEISVEPEAMGTAGALAFARRHLTGDPVMVMNGDSYIPFALTGFLADHRTSGAAATLLATEVADAQRFGLLDLGEDGTVLSFHEKSAGAAQPGWINAGVYLLSAAVLDEIARRGKGSLERDIFPGLPAGSLRAHRVRERFIDIGTPDSLAQAAGVILESG